MKILGEDGIGKFLKIFLQICFAGGIIFLISLPFWIENIGLQLNEISVIIYPNGIALLAIVYQFIGLFDSLRNNNPFSKNNVKKLRSTGNISIISGLLWVIDLVIAIFLASDSKIILISVFAFMSILFTGVAIALYILSELIRQGAEYKEENELTI